MANSCESTWAGRFVICLQLFSWCAVGALLLHRGFISVKHQEVIKPDMNTTSSNDSYFDQSERIRLDMLVVKPTKISAESDIIDKANNLIELESGNATVVVNTTEDGENVTTKATPATQTTSTHVHNVRVPPSTKRRYDLTPSGVVMAALGVVMLVVGPSVVILRCCDSGRQGSRFDKLNADDRALDLAAMDQPPSYDEVAGRAPRYSMLFPDDETSVV